MHKLEPVELLSSKRDFFILFGVLLSLLALSLSYNYYKYHQLTKFDSQIVNALVLKQYTKTKVIKNGRVKRYEVLKLRADDGATFYTIANKNLKDIKNRTIQLEIWAGKISFYEFMKGFFVFSKILTISHDTSLMKYASTAIASQHRDKNISALYEALFLAKPLPQTLQKEVSTLGISHLIAISGFHLGVLSTLLFFLLKIPYKFLQNRYFPYRNYNIDSFLIIAFILFGYMLFLSYPPSLLRAFVMMVVGFVLYQRGVKIISMQTLSITLLLILALFPRLLFSIGFWLSIGGVFYIFLFFLYAKDFTKTKQFFLLPIWLYLMMLPYSLALFGNFSLSHPLSILYSILFTLFYPVTLLLHLIGYGGLLDGLLQTLISSNLNEVQEYLPLPYLGVTLLLSLFAIFHKKAFWLLLGYNTIIFSYLFFKVIPSSQG